MKKQKSIFQLLFFEQRLLGNHRRYHLEIFYTYLKQSNLEKRVSEF